MNAGAAARPRLPVRELTLGAVAVPSVILSGVLILVTLIDPIRPFDWGTFQAATSKLWTGDLYHWTASVHLVAEEYSYRYAPLFAVLMVPFVWLGLDVWRFLHLAALAVLPPRVALLTLAFAPFWYDVYHGNVLTFAFVLAWLALSGNRWAAYGFLALAVLVPRPLMAPLAVWLLWRRPETRWPFGGMVALSAASLLVWPGFVGAFIASGAAESVDNLAPSALIGWAWIPIGLTLAVWLTWRGRLGLASLAASPYVLPYYLLLGLLDLTSGRVPLAGSKREPP